MSPDEAERAPTYPRSLPTIAPNTGDLAMTPEPTPIRRRDGCKVSWEVFRTKKEAKQRAVSARKKADELEAKGFDWGYQSPGSIRKVEDGYEVVCP